MQCESRVVPWFQRSLKVDFKTATHASFYMNLPSLKLTLLQLAAHLTIWIIVCCNLKTYARQMNQSSLWAIIIISLIKGKKQARQPDCVLNCYITSDQSCRGFPLHLKMFFWRRLAFFSFCMANGRRRWGFEKVSRKRLSPLLPRETGREKILSSAVPLHLSPWMHWMDM